MFTLIIENQNGKQLNLSQNEDKYQIETVEGLTPPSTELTTIKLSNYHGVKFKSSKIEERNIVITLSIKGEVEKNRIALYDFFNVGHFCKIFYKNENRNVQIEGYCENFNTNLFTNNQIVQASILCPDPFWKNVAKTVSDISMDSDNFTFPFAIDEEGVELNYFEDKKRTKVINYGDENSDVIIRLKSIQGTVENPVVYKNNQFIKLNEILNQNEQIEIDTNRGKKTIIKIVDGIKTNILDNLSDDSTWLNLDAGINIFTYLADTNYTSLKVEVEYCNRYKGV